MVQYEKLESSMGEYEDISANRSFEMDRKFIHARTPKSLWKLVGLSLAVAGLDICYSAELVYGSPMVLKYHVPEFLTSFIWLVSPLIGFILTPLLGSLSDTCTLSLGRRRPFIILLSIFIACGALLLSQSANLLSYIDSKRVSTKAARGNHEDVINLNGHYYSTSFRPVVIVLTVIGVAILDFGCDSCQSPCRAYIIDVVPPEEHQRAFSVMGVCAGIGGTLGYLWGTINFQDTWIGEALGGQEETVFLIALVIFVILAFITVCQEKEIPLSATANLPENPQGGAVTYKEYLLSIVHMPKTLRVLCIQAAFSWSTVVSCTLFVTDFVGQVVYGGDPYADTGTVKFKLYNEGVRFGSIALASMTITVAVTASLFEKVLKFVGCRTILLTTCCLASVGYLLNIIWPCRVLVIFMAASVGLVYMCVMVVPFLLIARYHEPGSEFLVISTKTVKRGLGTDIAIAQSMVFVAQIVTSIVKGPVQQLIGGYNGTCIILGLFFSLGATVLASMINYADL